jgi:hypothetical protein
LKNGVIYLEFKMKSSCILIVKNYNTSWLFVFWINSKFNGHYLCFNFNLSSHIVPGTRKPDTLSNHSYLTPKEGNEAYDQQCDIIIKLEHLWLQALWVAFDDKPFFSNLWRFNEGSLCYWLQRLIV